MQEFTSERRKQRIREVLSRRQRDLALVMDNIWDPHNVSAILRSCDAFGVHEVHLYYTTEPFPQIGKKSSASAWKWVQRRRHQDEGSLRAAMAEQNMRLLVTGFSERAKPLTDWDLTEPTAVVLSNEHAGTKPELSAMADGEIYIPMMGMIPSFNVSVAAGLILYEAWRQRYKGGLYDSPSLHPEELERLYESWCAK